MEYPQPLNGSSSDKGAAVWAGLLSCAALLVSLLITSFLPDGLTRYVGILMWLLAFVPLFLLSVRRRWRGVSVGLAVAALVYAGAQVAVMVGAASPSSPVLMLVLTTVLVGLSLGAGILAMMYARRLRAAQDLALTDTGTGLPNRRHGMLHLERAFAAAHRGDHLTVVLFEIALDRIRDQWGRDMEDSVLRHFVRVLVSRTRRMHVSARLDRTRFLAVLDATDIEGASIFARKVLVETQAMELPWAEVFASAGVAAFEPAMQSEAALLAAAEEALDRANSGDGDPVALERADAGPEPHARRVPPSAAHRAPGGETVLVVDDDSALLRVLVRVLKRAGYRVQGATTPERAERLAIESSGDLALVVTDIEMPGMDGFELVDRIQAHDGPVPVLYVSAYDREDIRWDMVPGTPTAFLGKPFDMGRFLHEVRALADRSMTPERAAGAEEPEGGVPLHIPQDEGSGHEVPDSSMEWPVIAEAPEESKRVLVADDDPSVLRGLERLLMAEGLWVEVAPDGAAALDAAALMDPDLVLLDTGMPNVDGLPVLQHLRSDPSTRLTPVVLIAESESREACIRGIQAGADDFISKPFDGAEVLARVRSLLRVKEYTNELDRAELVLKSLARAVEERDPYTRGHCDRLAALCRELGVRLDLSVDRVLDLERAAYLHDIGKVMVPDGVLRKRGPLTSEERRLIELHPEAGERICQGLRSLQHVLPIIRHHHERRDGSGYPDGLVGEQIPRTARVFQIVDVYDALTTERPFKEALSSGDALAVMRTEVERGWWDPEIFEVFATMVRRPVDSPSVPERAPRYSGTPAYRDAPGDLGLR